MAALKLVKSVKTARANKHMNIEEVIREFSTVNDFLRWGYSLFNEHDLCYGHGTDNSWDEIVHLVYSTLHFSLDCTQDILNAKLLAAEKKLLADRIRLRIEKRIPVSYLTNEAWFCGLSFYVDERVIIPRSPMAELIESEFSPWVDSQKVTKILDLCTGSGCIAIACAVNFPEAEVDAVDISTEALVVAQKNVNQYGLEQTIHLIQSDLFKSLPRKQYDIIISNPPYVPESVYDTLPDEYSHEPSLALKAGQEGLSAVEEILKKAGKYLSPNGVLIVEVGELQPLVEQVYPTIPFTWLQFEEGEDGVFLLTAQELKDCFK
jgi:ribosomal protein L3 glutamine methyltransferase